MTQLYRVLYCSRNRLPETTATGIQDVLRVSRRNNARDEITGALLFSARAFAQALEGPLDVVSDAFERIQCDERHSDVVVLQSGPIAKRDFPDWAMAFARAEDQSNSLAVVALTNAFSGLAKDGNELLDLLRAIVARETDWRGEPMAPSRQEAASGT
jgi:blue light- and temperature-responsive anti-repressor